MIDAADDCKPDCKTSDTACKDCIVVQGPVNCHFYHIAHPASCRRYQVHASKARYQSGKSACCNIGRGSRDFIFEAQRNDIVGQNTGNDTHDQAAYDPAVYRQCATHNTGYYTNLIQSRNLLCSNGSKDDG